MIDPRKNSLFRSNTPKLPSLGIEEFHQIAAGSVLLAGGLDKGSEFALFSDLPHQFPNLAQNSDRTLVRRLFCVSKHRLELFRIASDGFIGMIFPAHLGQPKQQSILTTSALRFHPGSFVIAFPQIYFHKKRRIGAMR